MKPDYSIIIPVYNRPDEVKELLESLNNQTCSNFELVLVEDGSSRTSEEAVREYSEKLEIRYFFKPNTGRSDTRNYGMERATGNYFVFFDSDCIIPPDYFSIVTKNLKNNPADCFGGPDNAHESFSDLQKAINYSMTSFFTTGGIRGGKKQLEKFTPRTFNMGFSRKVYEAVGGFKDMFGEDIDLSIRIREAGFSTRLIRDAFVYHKRRVDLRSFYRQVYVFGMARIDLYRLYPDSLKAVHALPAVFTAGSILLLLLSFFYIWAILPLAFYLLVIFTDSLIRNKNIKIAALSVLTGIIQLTGYGFGFIGAFIRKIILKQKGDLNKELKKHYKKK